MKKIIKVLSVFICAAMLAVPFTACKSKTSGPKKLKIGVIQYMSHPSLDNCYKGIAESLKNSGLDVEIDHQTGSSNSAAADCSTFAQNMVAKNCDMIIAIATPAATSAYSAVEGTDIPLVFCAVSDPVSAKLVKDIKKPGVNCTGTSDVLDLSAQVSMIKTIQPDVKSIGVLYTTSEQNSITQLKNLRAVCDKEGIKVVDSGVQNGSDIPSAAAALTSKVDCLNNFTDNNVVENLSVVLDAANSAKIPVYGSEVEQVKNGCLASMSIDYVALGKTTGDMATKILKGAKAKDMPVETISKATPVINSDVISSLHLQIPEKYKDAQTVTLSKK